MKKILLCLFVSAGLAGVAKDPVDKKIKHISTVYAEALAFAADADAKVKIPTKDLFNFFSTCKLFSKKDLAVLRKEIKGLARLAKRKKHADKKEILKQWIDTLEKLHGFAKRQGQVFYVMSTIQEIEHFYRNLDPNQKGLAEIIASNPELFQMHSKKRCLYNLVKKIDLDLRRIKHLFASYAIADDLVVQLNDIKLKLFALKEKLVISSLYKAQRRKVRILKAIGVVFMFPFVTALMVVPIVMPFFVITNLVFLWTSPLGPSVYIGSSTIGALVAWGITLKELHQARAYKIPVHSESIYSYFAPSLVPLTWVERG